MAWRAKVLKQLKATLIADYIDQTALQDKEKALYKAAIQQLNVAELLCKSWLKKPIKAIEFKLCFAMAIAEIEEISADSQHAAIYENVNLLKKNKKTFHLTGTLNALLRKYLQERPINLPKIPQWIFDKISADYEDAEEIIGHLYDIPEIDLRPREGFALKGDKQENGAVRIPPQDITKLLGYSQGQFYVQDEAAQLPGTVLKELITKTGVTPKNIIDICCAPGGKLFHFKDICPESDILGVDINPLRLERLQENAKRLNLNVTTQQADMLKLKGNYDFVSLDAPCSATGTSRRHPEVFFRQTASDVTNLIDLQRQAITQAAKLVNKGGYLLYSTCSLFKSESEEQILGFLEKNADFSLVDLSGFDTLSSYANEQGMLRTTPAMFCDGFFVALLQKL